MKEKKKKDEGEDDPFCNDHREEFRPGSPRKVQRPYSHSDLGFSTWSVQDKTDAGACLGLDFGGTLSKIVFFEPSESLQCADTLSSYLLSQSRYGTSGVRDDHLSFFSEKMGGRLHFINFETSHTEGAVKLLQRIQHNIRKVHATGGGAFKFSKMIKEELGIRLMKQDELQTVVRGIIFTLLEHPGSECYTFESDASSLANSGVSHVDALSREMVKIPKPMKVDLSSFFPLLVVNIGSGVSIVNVTGPNSYKRVSGTAIGGATYFGLCKLLCRCESFDQALDLAQLGDSRNVNMTVQDIYGGSYEQAGLSGEITASFFGKAAASHGNVRTSRSRKRPFVSFLERIALVIVALLCANLISISTSSSIWTNEGFEWFIFFRTLLLIALPLGLAYFVFLSGEAQRASSHPPLEPAPKAPTRKKSIYDLYSARDNVLEQEQKYKKEKKTQSQKVSANFEEADVARALVVMVAQNVTQVAFLNARLYNSKRVLFTGNFLRHNKIALRALCSMMHNWSQGTIEALFMEHEGYFGAIGTWLYSTEQQDQTMRASSVSTDSSFSSDEERNVIEDLLFKGDFPRRRSVFKKPSS